MKIALVGDPNTGKSTFFNMLTGMRQTIGNWPGVTVEQLLGIMKFSSGAEATVVDLPGIYSLHATSEDERVAATYARFGEADIILNVVDAVNLERNLYLTMALMELGRPMVIVLTMMDIVERQGTKIDCVKLSKRLGVPVVRAVTKEVEVAISQTLALPLTNPQITYPPAIQRAAEKVRREGEAPVNAILRLEGIEPGAEELINNFEASQGTTPDVLIADARYSRIEEVLDGVITRTKGSLSGFSLKADRLILNRWLGLPIFFGLMYLLFWFTQEVGGCFIDFFDIAGGAIFVDGFGRLLTWCHSPDWLVSFLATGIGTGLQTVATFIPPVFFIFLGLSILEDSGYMARAAYVMDRAMRFLGLPGSAFVPMLVGFGCTVPAVMATRTQSSRRDRLLTVFMAPFMSCGARLPVFALFGAAFFGQNAGVMVFSVYLVGIALAIITGLLLKNTLFRGHPTPFIMELPLYHVPNIITIFKTAGGRLNAFIGRAGKVIVVMVCFLTLADTIAIKDQTLLNYCGRAITPVFRPLGIEDDNWQASVALFTGLFAKEAIVGSLNSLYATEASAATTETGEAEEEEEAPTPIGDQIKEAFASIGANIAGLFESDEEPAEETDAAATDAVAEVAEPEEEDEEASTIAALQKKFTKGPHQAFAYLLFILLYVPCLAALATIIKEIGWSYGLILSGYLTLLGWAVSTLYYQITIGHSVLWMSISGALLAAIALLFTIFGKTHPVKQEN